MSKDPAFLFYSSDFLTGTMLMTDEQVGKYIRLLCLQHQKGRLSEKHMLSICKAYDEDIFSKFIKDDSGLFYNKRLEDESIKRAKYTESRRNNASKPKKDTKAYAKHVVEHMENENENINEDINKDINRDVNSNLNSSTNRDINSNINIVQNEKIEKDTATTSAQVFVNDIDKAAPTFDDFWQEYPRKTQKVVAQKAWAKLKVSEKVASMEKIVDFCKGKEIQFIPHPSTYLNQKRWEDEIIEPNKKFEEVAEKKKQYVPERDDWF